MKKLVFLSIALSLVCASCTREVVDGIKTVASTEDGLVNEDGTAPDAEGAGEEGEERIVVLRMTIPENLENPASGGEGSRSTVDDSGYFTWQAGDQIGVYREGNINPVRFNLIEGAGTRYGVFEAAYSFSGKLTGYALYPYDWDSTLSGTTLTVHLPNTPDYNEGKAYLPMLATGVTEEEGADFSFKALGALLKFTYKEIPTQAARFRFTTKNVDDVIGPVITGSANVDLTAANPVLGSASGAGDNQYRFTINMPAHNSPIGEMSFYVPLPPDESYKFLISLRNSAYDILMGSQKMRASAYAVQQGKLHLMPVVTIPGVYTFEDGSIPENVTATGVQSAGYLKVVDNEFPVFTSSLGKKVLKADIHTTSHGTSGYFYIYFTGNGQNGTVNGKEYVTPGFLSNCSTFRVRFYHTATACYPRIRINDSNTGYRPARINGNDFTGSNATQANWTSWFKTNDWNVLEWDASQFGLTDFSTVTRFNFRPFSLWDGSNIPAEPASAAIPRIFYIDDFELVQNLPVTDEYL